MNYQRATEAYTESAVLSATPGQLVVMLYDGAIRFLQQAQKAMEADRKDVARTKIFRTESIINELNITLDMEKGGEVADRLSSIYLWVNSQITQALVDNDAQALSAPIEMLGELRDAWHQVGDSGQN